PSRSSRTRSCAASDSSACAIWPRSTGRTSPRPRRSRVPTSPAPSRSSKKATDRRGGPRAPMARAELKAPGLPGVGPRGGASVGSGERIRRQPELGFKEVKTAKLVEDTLRGLGLAPRTGLAFTGVRADAAGGRGSGPTFALIGELDALVVAGHPEADPATGAAH